MAIKGVVASSGGKSPTSISTKAVSAGKAAVSPKSSPAPSYKQTSYITPTYQTIQSYNTPSYAPPAAPAAVPKATTISQQAITAGKAQISQPKPAQIAPGIATINDIGAVGGQKKVTNSDGGYSLLTRSSEDTYNVARYRKDGTFIESYSRSPGKVESTVGYAAPTQKSYVTVPTASIKEKITKATPKTTPVYEEALAQKLKSGVSSPVAVKTQTLNTVPTGEASSPTWRASNESGAAPVVSQLDYSSVLGYASLGKWLLKKLALKAVSSVPADQVDDYLDDLKYRLESGQMTDDEYYTMLKEYVDTASGSSVESKLATLNEISEAIRTFSDNGGVPLASALTKAYSTLLSDSGYVVSPSPAAPGSTVQTQGIGDWLQEKYEQKVAPAIETIKEGIGWKADDEGVSSASVSASSVPVASAPVSTVEPVQRTVQEVQYPPASAPAPATSATPLLNAVTSGTFDTQYTLDIEGGNIYPVTDEEKAQAARAYLDKKYSAQSGEGQDNELIAKYFWFMVPQLSQNGVDYHALADTARTYENMVKGDTLTLLNLDSTLDRGVLLSSGFSGLDFLSQDEQKSVIKEFNKKMIESGIPGPAMALFNAGLSEACGTKTAEIQNWMTEGGLVNDIKSDWVWNKRVGATEWLSSEQGMAALGAGMGLIGVVGAFMTGGVFAAAGATQLMTFNTSEFFGNFGDQAWKTKGELQLSGEYSQDHVSAINTVLSASNSAISNIGFAKSLNDPSVNLQNIENAERALKSAQESAKDNWQYLEAANVYNDKIRQIQIQEKALETNKAMFDSQGNFIAKENPPIEVRVINSDKSWKITYENLYGRGDGAFVLGKLEDNFTGDVVVTDSSGVEIGRQQVKSQLFSGDQVIDAQSIVKQSQKYSGMKDKEPKVYKRTIVLQPGQQMTIGDWTSPKRDTESKWDIDINEGIPRRITFTEPGKEDLVEYLGAQGVAWDYYVPELKPAFTKAPEEVKNQGFKLATSPQSTVKINGKVYAAQGDKDTVPTAPGYYQVEVSTPGKETWQKTVYIGEGQYMAISDASQDIEEEKSYSSSSGGGGGGGGGSSGGSEDVTYAMIIYGETCRNARVWQDDTEIAPEIGKIYSISPGYHAIKVQKTGKKVWLKTVYCMAGDSVTVSPALEDETSTTTPTDTTPTNSTPTNTTPEPVTRRVYFNSDPSSSRVMINGGFSGEWTPCFLDLPHGYYKVQILKTGYKPQDHTLYVGSVIAWDSYADQLANMEGIYFD